MQDRTNSPAGVGWPDSVPGYCERATSKEQLVLPKHAGVVRRCDTKSLYRMTTASDTPVQMTANSRVAIQPKPLTAARIASLCRPIHRASRGAAKGRQLTNPGAPIRRQAQHLRAPTSQLQPHVHTHHTPVAPRKPRYSTLTTVKMAGGHEGTPPLLALVLHSLRNGGQWLTTNSSSQGSRDHKMEQYVCTPAHLRSIPVHADGKFAAANKEREH